MGYYWDICLFIRFGLTSLNTLHYVISVIATTKLRKYEIPEKEERGNNRKRTATTNNKQK